MDVVSLLIQFVSGITGGNVAGSVLKNLSLGMLGNSLAGLVGGSLGTAILTSALGPAHVIAMANLDAGAIVSQIAGGGVGGGVLMVIVGLLKQVFSR